jgi:hypothetical protein
MMEEDKEVSSSSTLAADVGDVVKDPPTGTKTSPKLKVSMEGGRLVREEGKILNVVQIGCLSHHTAFNEHQLDYH